jgi:hypothetical protein
MRTFLRQSLRENRMIRWAVWLAALGALTTAWWRQEEPVAAKIWAAAKRIGYRRRKHGGPFAGVQDAGLLQAVIACGFLGLDAAPSAAQIARVSASLAQNSRTTLDESDDRIAVARWLVEEMGEAAIMAAVARLWQIRGRQDLVGLMDLLEDGVLAGAKGLGPRQKVKLAEIGTGLGLALKA